MDRRTTSPSRHKTTLTAFVGGYMGDSYSIEVHSDGTFSYVRFGRHYTDPQETRGHLSEDELVQRMNALTALMEQIMQAEGRMRFETQSVDGTSWSVSLSWQGKRLSLSGLNDYPAAWPELRKAVEDLAGGRTWA